MALKGITKIELFDAKTGIKTNEIVKENMVTNAVKNILNPSLQMITGQPKDSYDNITTQLPDFLMRCSPIGKVLFGGVLIFSEALDENVDNIIPNISDRKNIVGYAGQYAGLTGNNYKGSYNVSESVKLSNGFTHVWDFSTEQANGTIAAIALTSAMGGDCGWNTPDNVNNHGNFLIPILSDDFTADTKKYDDTDFAWYRSTASNFFKVRYSDSSKNSFNEFVCNGEYTMLCGLSDIVNNEFTCTYTVSKMACEINLNEKITNNQFENEPAIVSTNSWAATEDLEYLRAYAFDSTYRVYSYSGDVYRGDYTTVIKYKDFTLNDDGTVAVSELVTLNISNNAVINAFNTATGSSLDRAFFSCNPQRVYLDSTALYLQGTEYNGRDTSGYVAKIALANTSDVSILSLPLKLLDSPFNISKAFNGVLLANRDNNKNRTYFTTDFTEFIRLDSGMMSDCLVEKKSTCIKEPYVTLCESEVDSYHYGARTARVCLLAPYLATINNLQTPVVKTTSKTMKITYTIQNTQE